MKYKMLSFVHSVPNNDIRPGLIYNKSVKRQHEMTNKRSEEIEKNKKLRLINSEESRRQRGLQEPISSNNKGFSLLQKMGYKPGQGIGKTGIILLFYHNHRLSIMPKLFFIESGNPEPITIAVKTDRFGLGRETVLKEIADWREKKRIQKVQKTEQICDINTYRRRIAEKAQEKQIKADLYGSQKLCEKFDKDKVSSNLLIVLSLQIFSFKLIIYVFSIIYRI